MTISFDNPVKHEQTMYNSYCAKLSLSRFEVALMDVGKEQKLTNAQDLRYEMVLVLGKLSPPEFGMKNPPKISPTS